MFLLTKMHVVNVNKKTLKYFVKLDIFTQFTTKSINGIFFAIFLIRIF